MQTLNQGYRAFGLLLAINWDRLLFPTSIFLSLMTAAYLANILLV